MKAKETSRRIALALTCGLAVTIGEYTTSGATINASPASGVDTPCAFAIAFSVPEPSTVALAGLGLGVTAWWLLRRRETN